MTKQNSYIDYLDDDDDASQGFIDRGTEPTESIDLQGLIAELETLTEDFQTDDLKLTPLGKLMDVLPISVLILDKDRRITFLNQAVGKISSNYDSLKGKECASLFPDAKIGSLVDSLIETVHSNRQIQLIEALVQIDDSKIWGRVHLLPLRWGSEVLVLALIEDLTLEKTQLSLQKKLRRELEKRVEERTKDLASMNEKLQGEIGERKRAESELIRHRQNLEHLVVERTRDLNSTVARLKQEVRERKKAESSLRSSEHRLKLAFHANPGAVSIMSLDDERYVDVNASFCRFSGYLANEVIGRTDEELKFWAHEGLRESMIETLKESRSVKGLESVFRSKSGRMRVGSLSAELMDLDGQPHILCVVIDITDQKRAERDQNLFAAAIDRIDESVLISDARGVIKFANSAFEKASGYSREELRGKDTGLVRSPENEQDTLNQLDNLTKLGKPWHGRLINMAKDGSKYEVESTVSPVSGKSARLMNFVLVERPVDSMSLHGKQVLQAPKALDSGGAAGLALEVNNVFAALMGYAFLAAEKLDSRAAACQDLARLVKIGERAADLVGRLLALSGTAEEEYRLDQLASGTERILLIDSEEESATLGRGILESVGYKVTALTNVSEAISTFESNPAGFDLVISDLTMPIMSGFELAEALKAIREDVRVLLCAGRGKSLNVAEIRRSCIRDLLVRPFLPKDFCNAVRNALD